MASSRASPLPHWNAFPCGSGLAREGGLTANKETTDRLILPAIRRRMIAVPPFHPTRAVAGVFFLPEWRAGFQVVHHERAGIECSLTMGTGGSNEDDRLTRFQGADAVQHFKLEQRPALLGLDGNFAQGLRSCPDSARETSRQRRA